MIAPIAWMFSTSLRTPQTSFDLPPRWFPTELRWENYSQAFGRQAPLLQMGLNSLKIAVLITLGQLISASTAAYAFARLRFPGRGPLFAMLLSGLMVPYQITLIPIFILIRSLGLMDTHEALILPALISVFGVFLLRQFCLTIPDDLEDAARIDGAGFLTIFVRIILPLIGPALSTLAIFAFNQYWNEFFRPLIFLNSWEKMTWPLGLVVLRGEYGEGGVSILLAGVSSAVLPVVVVFLFAQRYIIQGITLTGIRG